MFSRQNRLSKTSDVQRVLAQGRAFFNPFFTIRFSLSPDFLRFTVVVSTKVDKRAVRRNRLKRLVRESLRKNMAALKKGDYVVILKPKAEKLDDAELLNTLGQLLAKAGLLK